MSKFMTVYGANGLGLKTASAGTVIQHLVPPRKGAFSRISTIKYTAAATAHTITVMQELGRTTLSADAAASQAVVNLSAQPTSGNNVAANDFLVIALDKISGQPDRFILVKVSSVSSLAITLTANLSEAITSGATVWHMGITTDTVPATGAAHPAFSTTASATVTHTDASGGIVASPKQYSPLVVNSNNATDAGTLEQVSYLHTRE